LLFEDVIPFNKCHPERGRGGGRVEGNASAAPPSPGCNSERFLHFCHSERLQSWGICFSSPEQQNGRALRGH